MSSFTSALIVVGGSGITFALSCIEDLIMKAEEGASRTRVIQLVWVVQDPCESLLLSKPKRKIALIYSIPLLLSSPAHSRY